MNDSYPMLLLPGDRPDPTVLRVGDDYYMTHSSFRYAPAFLLWHSTDLFHWTPLTHALADNHGDIWAPDLVQHDGRFFIYYKTHGGNHVIHADHITGPWSDPICLDLGYIDPGHVVDHDGTRYLHLSEGRAVKLSANGLSKAGEYLHVLHPWPIAPVGLRHEGVHLEGPKLLWRNRWCHLLAAQGGTAGPATSHMAVHARSRTALGPWEWSPHNPVVRTMSRDQQWWSTGHGSVVQGPDGQWWMIFHGYQRHRRTLGRQTLIAPVCWTQNDWLVSESGRDTPSFDPACNTLARDDDFQSPKLDLQWQFFDGLDMDRFRLGDGKLELAGTGISPADSRPLLTMPGVARYRIEVDVEVTGEGDAGLILYYSPDAAVALYITGLDQVRILRPRHDAPSYDRARIRRGSIRLVNDDDEIDFFVRKSDGTWRPLDTSLETSGLHHNVFGGFLSLRPGLFCSGSAHATFRQFRIHTLSRHPTMSG